LRGYLRSARKAHILADARAQNVPANAKATEDATQRATAFFEELLKAKSP